MRRSRTLSRSRKRNNAALPCSAIFDKVFDKAAPSALNLLKSWGKMSRFVTGTVNSRGYRPVRSNMGEIPHFMEGFSAFMGGVIEFRALFVPDGKLRIIDEV